MDKYKKITRLAPSISSENNGDFIIMDCCDRIISELFHNPFVVMLPTRERLSHLGCLQIASSDFSILCGTNILSSHIRQYSQWNINFKDALRLATCDISKRKLLKDPAGELRKHYKKNKIILLGVGWWQYQNKPDLYTTMLLRMMLSPNALHSVRDNYTAQKLKECGIQNVVNTACPTMWNLTEEHCKKIPTHKAKTVVTTFTNYNINHSSDTQLVDMLLTHYENVYIWLQAIEDYNQLSKYPFADKVKIIPPTLKAYDEFLMETETDYVGTRLHGGIRALNAGKRTVILAVDNRATEIAKDTNLPVLNRNESISKIEQKLLSPFETKINLPVENIQRWKQQFYNI